jgi:hypothetical protein
MDAVMSRHPISTSWVLESTTTEATTQPFSSGCLVARSRCMKVPLEPLVRNLRSRSLGVDDGKEKARRRSNTPSKLTDG